MTFCFGEVFLYVANFTGDTISVIDTTTNMVVDTIPTVEIGNGPKNMAISSDGQTLYVAVQNDDEMAIVNTIDNMVTTTVSVVPDATDPQDVVLNLDGTIAYVINQFGDDVSVVDLSTNTVSTTIATGALPQKGALSPDGAFLYVTNRQSDDVSKVDTSTNMEVAEISVGNFPTGIAITPDGSKAYVCNRDGGSISVIDLSDDSVTTINGIDTPQAVAVNPEGTRAYVTERGLNNLLGIDTSSDTVVQTLNTTGTNIWDVLVNNDGSTIYIGDNDAGEVIVVDVATFSETTTITVGGSPRGLEITPTSDDPDGIIGDLTVTGRAQKNVFLTQTDFFNVLTWTTPSDSAPVVDYQIVRDGIEIAKISANAPRRYEDHKLKKGHRYRYTVNGLNTTGTAATGTATIMSAS